MYNFTKGFLPPSICKEWFLKGGLLVLDDLMVEGDEDKAFLDLFTKHSHHQNITVLHLCQDMFPPGKYAKSIFRNAHYMVAFKKSTRSIRDEEFTASNFSHLLARHDGRVSKSDRTTVWVHDPRFTSCQRRQETRI